jgi:DUF1680 family protein
MAEPKMSATIVEQTIESLPQHGSRALGERPGLREARWTGGFWGDRMAVCRESLVPTMGRLMGDSDRPRFLGNFEVAAGRVAGRHRGPKWNDGDFYKWFEAAAATFALTGDAALGRQLDEIIELIGAAQDPDGYIHTDVQIRQRAGEAVERFGNPMDFEMYNMGHLMSAACAHLAATGKRSLLDCAIRAADFLARQFAAPTPAMARHGICPAHLMGLIDLARTTGQRKYVALAAKLLDMRDRVAKGDDDNQDRVPFRQQREAVGHGVRATYLYAGAADLYAEAGDDSLLPPLQSIWTDLVTRKLYITGGCGALFDGASPDGSEEQLTITRVHQAFGRNYQLPHSTAHNETCAAIGNLLWNWRMLLVTGEGRFADVLEQSLYNSVLAGVSLDGTKFFYTNTLRQLDTMPVELRWNRHRAAHIGCFCCPPNVARVLAQSATYAYVKGHDSVWVVLYGCNELQTTINGGPLHLMQETAYPWDGTVHITVHAAPAGPTAIRLRIPGWCDDAAVSINGESMRALITPGEFLDVRRRWEAGDTIQLELPMRARKLAAHPLVEEARNHVAVMRGPLVYCLESADLPAGVGVMDVLLPADAPLGVGSDPSLPGITVLTGKALAAPPTATGGPLYQELANTPTRPLDVKLVPYYAWDNRGDGEMSVWLPLAR